MRAFHRLYLRPDLILQAEGLAVLVATVTAFHSFFPHRWLTFVALFLAPDLALIAYAGPNKAFAATLYNLAHTYVFPVILGLSAWHAASALEAEVSLIWMSHIAFDRLLRYGLKSPAQFKLTHIQAAALLPSADAFPPAVQPQAD